MKILIVMTTPLLHDGLTKMIQEIIKYSDRSKIKFSITVLSGSEKDLVQWLVEEKITIYEMPSKKYITKYFNSLHSIVLNEDFQLVHIHGNSCMMLLEAIAVKNKKIRLMAHCHNTATNHKILHKAFKNTFNQLITDKVACSELAGKWVYNSSFRVMKNGIEVEKYQFDDSIRNTYRSKLGIEDKFVVGHVGRFNKQKNHAMLIDIFFEICQIHSDAVLLLIGEGELESEIRNKVNQKGINEKVIFLGVTQKVNCYLQAMDIMVFPSLYEGFGIVGIEAQATGLAVIASNTIPREMAVSDCVEWKSLSDTPKEWARVACHKTSINRKKYNEIVKNAGYDIQQSVNQLQNWYLEG